MICPMCGELVVVQPDTQLNALVVPTHPDRVMPFEQCTASAEAITAIGRMSR